MGNSTRRRSDAHSGAARSTAASRPHCADHWRELSAERQAQSGINQGCEESVTGPGVGQFYFGVFGPGWVKIQSALTHFNARAISRKPRPSDSRRLISAYRSTVNFLRAIATPSASCKTDDGTGPNRHRRRLARGWSQSEEIGWVQFQEIRWSPSQEIGWSQSEEILHRYFLEPRNDAERKVKRAIEAYRAIKIPEWEQEIFKQRKRYADAERALRTKHTKKAESDLGVSSRKIEQLKGWLDGMKTLENKPDDVVVHAMNYGPVIVSTEKGRMLTAMRYHCRLAGES